MKIIQRYILREVLIVSLLSLCILTFLLLARTIFVSSEDAPAGALTLGASLRILLNIMPSIFSLTVPISFLVGVLLAIGRMTADSEIKACRTHGVNLWTALYPVAVLGGMLSIVGVINSAYIAPYLLGKTFDMIDEMTFEIVNTLEPGKFEDRFGVRQNGAILHFEELDPETKHLRRVYLQVEGNPVDVGMADTATTQPAQTVKTEVYAASGLVETDPIERKAVLTLFNGTVHVLQDDAVKRYSILEFDRWSQDLQMSRELSLISDEVNKLAPALTSSDMGKFMKRLDTKYQETGDEDFLDDIRYLRAERFTRISMGMATLAFVLIAIPLAIYTRPSGKSVGISLAFGLFMAYYAFFYTGRQLTRQGFDIAGPLVTLAPVFILCGFGAYLMYRVVHR